MVFKQHALELVFHWTLQVLHPSFPDFELIYTTSFAWCRLDRLISEAINNLKEPRGSDRAAIALYIEVLMHNTFESKCLQFCMCSKDLTFPAYLSIHCCVLHYFLCAEWTIIKTLVL